MFEPKLGVSIEMISQRTTPDVVGAVAQSRIATLELYGPYFHGAEHSDDKRQLRGLLAQTPIRPMTIHAPFGDGCDPSSLDDQARRNAVDLIGSSIDMAIEFDVPIVIIHAGIDPTPSAERAARLERAQESLVELETICRAAARQMAIELLPGAGVGNTVEELFTLLGSVGPDVFGVCLDTNHLMDRHDTLADVVRRLSDRLIALHISDYHGIDEEHLLPGKGVLDWKTFMAALRDIDYAGAFNYECDLDGDTPEARVQSLEANFDWMRAL